MELLSNQGLSLKDLFKKRDLIQQLMDMGYELQPEMNHLLDAINNKIAELRNNV